MLAGPQGLLSPKRLRSHCWTWDQLRLLKTRRNKYTIFCSEPRSPSLVHGSRPMSPRQQLNEWYYWHSQQKIASILQDTLNNLRLSGNHGPPTSDSPYIIIVWSKAVLTLSLFSPLLLFTFFTSPSIADWNMAYPLLHSLSGNWWVTNWFELWASSMGPVPLNIKETVDK